MSRAVPRFKRINAPLATLTTNAFRVTVFYLVDNQICLINQDYIMQTAVIASNTEANIASTFYTAVQSQIRAVLAADCFWTQIKVSCLTFTNRIPYYYPVPAINQAGSVAGNHIPSEMAAVVAKLTGVKGQHGRGRLYLPGIPSSFVVPSADANRLTAAGQSAIGSLTSAMFSASIADGTNVAQAGLTTRVPKGQAAVSGALLNTFIARALLGTVRRRRIGRGK